MGLNRYPAGTPRAAGRRRVAGFTLVELTVAMAIVALLAMVALPTFMGQVRKSRRSDAVAAILRLQQAQERWRANNTAYAATVATLTGVDAGLTSSSEKAYYTLATAPATGAAATGYSVTASAASGTSQSSDSACTTLTAVISGGTATYSPVACWSK